METLEEEFTQFNMRVMEGMGFDSISSKLFAFTFLEPDEMSLEDLEKKTGYSAASVCNKMQFMEKLGLVKRIKKPGTKKVYYYADKDFSEMMKIKVNIAFEKEINPAKEILPKIIEKHQNKQLSGKEKKRFEKVKDYYTQIIKFEKVLKKFMKDVEEL